MKNLKIILPVMAFMFAVALSFATATETSPAQMGEYVISSNPQACQPVDAGCEGEGITCTFLGQHVYAVKNGTTCNNLLERDPD
ncbi:DUF6520 family protein [Tamlana sp. I1]|uniref:DUF6520 family protein n=1 Tax=Tamlana sp. I1 TaxID=2762061 RepID=UPI001E51CE77|nr:DUF6520 family protein [Tamlana sp. I1]